MKVQRLLFMMAMSAALFSCGNGNTDNNGDWVSRAVFNGPGRGQAVAFTVGDSGYVGTGFGANRIYFQDFYRFSPTENAWAQIAPLPGMARASAASFATAKYGYVGTGINSSESPYPAGNGPFGSPYLEDFWRYDPTSNTWDSMPPVPIRPATGGQNGRYLALGIGVPDLNMGAILGGYDDSYTYNDLYIWNEAGNSGTWTVTSYPGPPRKGATYFLHDDHVYLVTGSGSSNQLLQDFWYWDPSKGSGTNAWSSNTFPNGPGPRPIGGITDQSYDAGYHIVRQYAVGFSMNNNGLPKGYVMFGSNGANLSDVWEYDFPTDTWIPRSPYPPAGGARAFAVSLTINDSAYVGLGTPSGSLQSTPTFYNDFTQFYPSLPYNQDDYTNY